jgi:hypothetical protein
MELKSKETERSLSKKERKELMEKIYHAGSEEYVTEWDKKGKIGKQKKKSKIKRGRKSRAGGARFELRVRGDLENNGWTVDKWSNNVDFPEEGNTEGLVVTAKRKFNPFSKVLAIGTGFPDFIAFQLAEGNKYKIVGVEVKMNGTLSKIEKMKCKFYLDKKIFSEIWIAKKNKVGRKIFVEYENFRERYSRLFK